MTIQNIVSQNINKLSDIQQTMLNNDKIEDKLNVTVVHFNPMKFKKNKVLALKFKNEMLLMDDVDLFIAELSYDNTFEITAKKMIDIYNYQQQITMLFGQRKI